MELIKITYMRQKDEFVRAYQKYLVGKKGIRKIHIIIQLLFLIISIFLYSYSKIYLGLIFSVFFIMMMLLSLYMLYLFPVVGYRQTIQTGIECTFQFSPDGIDYQTEKQSTHMEWNVYKELWEDDEFFFLIYNTKMYTAVPKRVFADYGELKRFQSLAMKSLGTNTRTL